MWTTTARASLDECTWPRTHTHIRARQDTRGSVHLINITIEHCKLQAYHTSCINGGEAGRATAFWGGCCCCCAVMLTGSAVKAIRVGGETMATTLLQPLHDIKKKKKNWRQRRGGGVCGLPQVSYQEISHELRVVVIQVQDRLHSVRLPTSQRSGHNSSSSSQWQGARRSNAEKQQGCSSPCSATKTFCPQKKKRAFLLCVA